MLKEVFGTLRIFLSPLFLIASLGTSAEPTQSGVEFLRAIVQADLRGDASARLSRVEYSSATAMVEYENRRKIGGPVPEVYALDTDPLVVVRDWEVVHISQVSSETSCILVNFETVAKTSGEGLPSWEREESREFIAISPPIMETVSYCAQRTNGVWMLVDPPLPRVNKQAVVAALQAELEAANRRLKGVKTADERAIKNMLRIRDSFARQLRVLLPL